MTLQVIQMMFLIDHKKGETRAVTVESLQFVSGFELKLCDLEMAFMTWLQ